MFYIYIIESEKDGTLYKGFTSNYEKRIKEHNAGLSRYTAIKRPWNPIYLRQFETKREALQAELRIKRCNSNYFQWLIKQPDNLLNK